MKRFTEEQLAKMREAGRRGGKVRNPNKGFGTRRDLASELGKETIHIARAAKRTKINVKVIDEGETV